MDINIYLILFIVFAGWLLSLNDNRYRRGVYIVVCCIILLLVAALRSPEWFAERYGLDTLAYKINFESTIDNGWEEVWIIISQYYQGLSDDFDVGYTVLKIIIGWFTDSFYIYSIIADLLFFVPFGIILYRYSTSMRQLIFAFVFYVALVQVFLLAGARQIFAIGFDMMAMLSVIDRKKWWAVLFFFLGVSVHLSSSLFLIPLLLMWFKVRPLTQKIIHLICFILLPLIVFYPSQAIQYLGNLSGSERYANYATGEIAGGASTVILLLEVLSLLCLIAIRRVDLQKKPFIQYFYVMVPMFTLLAPLIRAKGAMIRLSLYFHLFLVLLVPLAIDSLFKGRSKEIVNYVVIFALAYLTLKGNNMDYYFFWQK